MYLLSEIITISFRHAWVTISKMWHPVISKRLQIQQLNQDLKLDSILKKQVRMSIHFIFIFILLLIFPYLDEWDQNEKDHSISLGGAVKDMESSSLHLLVLCGAKICGRISATGMQPMHNCLSI